MKTTRWSLATVGALWTGLAMAASTALFAIDKYLSRSNVRLADLLRADAWRVLAMTAVVYLFLWAVFRHVVLKPVHQIGAHLYRIGLGRLKPLSLHSHVRELQGIVDGVNLMIRRMELDLDRGAIEHVQETLDRLRKLAHHLPERFCDEEAGELLRCATTLQSAFGALYQTASTEALAGPPA